MPGNLLTNNIAFGHTFIEALIGLSLSGLIASSAFMLNLDALLNQKRLHAKAYALLHRPLKKSP